MYFFLSSPYLEFCDPFHHFLNVNRGGFTTNKFETNSDRENKVNRAILCYLNAKVCYLGPVSRSRCLALTIALEVSKPIRFYGCYRWLALTMLRETRAWYFGGFFHCFPLLSPWHCYLGSSHTTLYLSKAFSFQLKQKNSVKIVPGFSLLSSCDGLSLEELHLKHLNLQQERRKQKANWKSMQWRGVQGGKENKQDFLPSFHAHLFSSTSHRDSSGKKPCQGLPRLPPFSPKRLCKPMVRCRGPLEPRLRHCQRDL